MAKRLIQLVVTVLIHLVSRVRITGFDNIPPDGKYIITANHLGISDALLIVYLWKWIDRDDVIVIVAEKWQRYAIVRWVVGALGFRFVDRYNPDLQTMREVIRRLDAGGFMVIAPEGTRSHTGALIEGKPGAAYLAAKSEAQIVPAAITGSEDSLLKRRLLRFKRLQIHIEIGEPYTIPGLPKSGRDEFLQEQTDEIMCRIAALLPPSYRGMYADHPRLEEILAQQSPA